MRNSPNPGPPKWPSLLIKLLVNQEYQEEIEGDMEEIFQEYLEVYNIKKARRLYWIETLKLLRPMLLKKLTGHRKLNFFGMIKLFVKTATRNLLRQKLVTFTSLISLVFGAVFFQLVNGWISNEITMDKLHSKLDRIYVSTVQTDPMADITPISQQLFFNLDHSQFPEIENTLQVHVYKNKEIKVITEQAEFSGTGFVTDSTFFEFFDFTFIKGKPQKALTAPSQIVITEDFAEKLFGGDNPMGRFVDIKCDQEGTYQVAAVVEAIPSNSSIYFDFIIPRNSQSFWRRIPQEFLLAKPGFDHRAYNDEIAYMGRQNERLPESVLSSIPLSTVYFEKPFVINFFGKYGNSTSVQTMTFIAIVILLISLLSFTNLQTTIQLSAIRKSGIKQVIGATKFDLSLEILVSSICYLVIAGCISFAVYQLAYPSYLSVFQLDLDHSVWRDLRSILVVLLLIVSVSAIFSLIKVFRVDIQQAISGKLNFLHVPTIQRTLTTIQFVVTIVLMIGTAISYYQFDFMLNKQTGLNQDNIISVNFFEITRFSKRDAVSKQLAYINNEIRKHPDVLEVSQGDMPIDAAASPTSWKRDEPGYEYTTQNRMTVDPTYDELLGLELIEGRFFSDSLDGTSDLKIVVNEAAMKFWNIDDIHSTKLESNTSGRQVFSFNIIGVVKDYHYEHLANKVKPLVLYYREPYADQNLMVRFRDGKEMEVVTMLEKLYRKVNPKGIFTYDTFSDKVTAQYQEEERTAKIYLAFTIVALLLSCIGLFTFALHESKRRTKEVGIRKVNGASVMDVFRLLSMSFMKTIIIAYLLAVPVGWYFMSEWLDNFANRIQIQPWTFLLIGAAALIFALVAVGWQTLTVARKNPVESLRYE